MGYTSRELYQIRSKLNLKKGKDFYMVGGMGHSSMVALGNSIHTKNQVICLDGDGSLIMHMGSLANIGYYAKKNYKEAEFFLRRAVELLPTDPIINDHYADTLWMLDKNIQARYFWNYILNLKTAEKDLKDSVGKKLIFGINNKL